MYMRHLCIIAFALTSYENPAWLFISIKTYTQFFYYLSSKIQIKYAYVNANYQNLSRNKICLKNFDVSFC